MKSNHSIERAVSLLRALARVPDGANVTALASEAGVPRATASRLLATLADQGLVQRLPNDDRYILGYELVRLGRAVDPGHALVLATRPALERLVVEFRETVTLAVPRPGPSYEVVCQIDAPRVMRVHDWSIAAQPLHATSAGKLVLAELSGDHLDEVLRAPLVAHTAATIVDPSTLRSELERVRRQGWAQMVDELEDGLTGISVPLYDSQRQLAAVLGITAATQRLPPRQRAQVVKGLKASVAELERVITA
jgi:IclR family transcriptional regulator, acetate operon repressor